jgi:phosphate/sulfate permease
MTENISSNLIIWWATTAILGGAIAVLLYFFSSRRQTKSTSNHTTLEQRSSRLESDKKLLNVFDVSKKSQSSQKVTGFTTNTITDRPFNSSYYYAHNNAKGGYKDGLSMEDYVMNQPKLLSRNGVAIQSPSHSSSEESSVPINNKESSTNHHGGTVTHVPIKVHPTFHSIPLNRYLWDDDGNADGIAKLYFDSLPSSLSGISDGSISWKDAGITAKDVKVKVIRTELTCALLVQIKTSSKTDKDDEIGKITRYHFYVPQLYGPVQEAKVTVKSKLLIVKLIKEKKKGNRIAWPQIHAKGAPLKDYIDIDLFLEKVDHAIVTD